MYNNRDIAAQCDTILNMPKHLMLIEVTFYVFVILQK